MFISTNLKNHDYFYQPRKLSTSLHVSLVKKGWIPLLLLYFFFGLSGNTSLFFFEDDHTSYSYVKLANRTRCAECNRHQDSLSMYQLQRHPYTKKCYRCFQNQMQNVCLYHYILNDAFTPQIVVLLLLHLMINIHEFSFALGIRNCSENDISLYSLFVSSNVMNPFS